VICYAAIFIGAIGIAAEFIAMGWIYS